MLGAGAPSFLTISLSEPQCLPHVYSTVVPQKKRTCFLVIGPQINGRFALGWILPNVSPILDLGNLDDEIWDIEQML